MCEMWTSVQLYGRAGADPEAERQAAYDAYHDPERGECGGCGREGRVHRAQLEGRVCSCGAVLCWRCWENGVFECVACRTRRAEEAEEAVGDEAPAEGGAA